MATSQSRVNVPEKADRLVAVAGADTLNADLIADCLRNDRVVLISNVDADAADDIMSKVAAVF